MKTLLAALAFAALIAVPLFTQSASAAPTFKGYPLSAWYTTDGW